MGVLLSACANDKTDMASLQTGSLALAAAPVAVRAEPLAAPAGQETPRKNMTDRVLTAIALERVTGLKPDPARLMQ